MYKLLKLSCASAERDIHDNNIWIQPIFTGWSHKNLLVFHKKISTLLFHHTCTHHWNRLVFTQCYNSTGQDWRHNSDRFRVSRGQILEASCVCSQFYGVIAYFDKHSVWIKVCEIRDLASDPSTRLFRRAIAIFDGQKNDHDGLVYRRAKWKLVKYSTQMCISFYKNGKYTNPFVL